MAQICLEGLVSRFNVVAVMMPYIVDADHQNDQIRLNVKEILLQTRDQMLRAIAADANIEKLKVNVRKCVGDHCGGELRISRAHVADVTSISTGIGDTVALKQNFHLFNATFRDDSN